MPTAFTAAVAGTPCLLETDATDAVPVSRQDLRRASVERDGPEGVQDGGGAGPHQQAGLAAHAATQLCHGTPGSGSRSAGDRALAGSQEFHHDDGLSPCAADPLGFGSQSAGLVAGAAVPTVGLAEQPTGEQRSAGEPAAERPPEPLRVIDDKLSALMLGNRRETYGLLFHAAWDALREVLRAELGCEPAALMVLHTWNQRLGHHPHIHALVPGGGPSLDGQQWVHSRHRYHHGRDRPYLVDHELLSERFRDKFVAGLTRLHRADKLKLEGEWSHLRDPAAFTAWRKTFSDGPWVVNIEPPPTEDAQPENVLKYLARYMTGGPISDRRLIEHLPSSLSRSAGSEAASA